MENKGYTFENIKIIYIYILRIRFKYVKIHLVRFVWWKIRKKWNSKNNNTWFNQTFIFKTIYWLV